MTSRRSVLRSLAGATAILPSFRPDAFTRLGRAMDARASDAPAEAARDERYWAAIRQAFDLDAALINLNNGGVCPAPAHVLEAMIRDLRFSNVLPVEHMWQVLEPRLEFVRRELAREFGCDPEEMAIVRNASEAQETMIFGLDLRRGDEVIVSNQNYPRMLTAWDQRVRRDGIVLKRVSFDVPPPSRAHVVERFRAAITPRTRAIEVTHITNLSGQILPVRELVELARPLGIEVLVDGAHAFAHFPFTRDQLGCDFYGTSLHKWLLAPIGTGFLYVRRDRVKDLWPLMAAPAPMTADVRKYEEIGTHPAANHNAIAAALAFHRGIGAERKVARLRWLRDRWARRLPADNPRFEVLTPLDGDDAGAIGLLHVEGLEPNAIVGWLRRRHGIVTTPINHDEFNGIRVTPNVYTTADEIDRFSEAMLEVARTGTG
jgi:selenocysteine lyase/cysteine desulfurase